MNFGNPVETTVLELAEHILKLVGGRPRIEYKPLPPDDPRQRQPEISLARRELDWEPRVALADGLKETVAYFRRRLEA